MYSGEASVKSWVRDHVPSPVVIWHLLFRFIQTLLPLPLWLLSYDWLRFWQDAAAGIVLSFVIVPQSILFGIMSQISPMHGMYSTFAGLALY